jgi:hypothetical protein
MIFAPFSHFFTLISSYDRSRRAVFLHLGGNREGKLDVELYANKKPLISRGKMFRN